MNPRPSDSSCVTTRAYLADLLDQEVTPRDAALLLEHLESCSDCASRYQLEYQTLAYLRASVQALAVPEGLQERIQDAVSRDTLPSTRKR